MQKRRISRPRRDKAPSCLPEPPWIIKQGRSLYCYHHSVLLVFNPFSIKYLTIAKLALMASDALGKTLRMIGPIFHAVHICKGLCISLEKILKRPPGHFYISSSATSRQLMKHVQHSPLVEGTGFYFSPWQLLVWFNMEQRLKLGTSNLQKLIISNPWNISNSLYCTDSQVIWKFLIMENCKTFLYTELSLCYQSSCEITQDQ